MTRILVTGMSGTGKSSALCGLAKRGHRTVDTDTDEWSRWVVLPDGSRDWILREDAVTRLLTEHAEGMLFVAGCKSNQGMFRRFFDRVVVLTAPVHVMRARILGRTDNPYGKDPVEWEAIIRYKAEVEPLLMSSATSVLDTTIPLDGVVRALEALGRSDSTNA